MFAVAHKCALKPNANSKPPKRITGAALIGTKTSKHEDPTTANNILLAGLAVQSFAFIIFLALYFRFALGLIKSGLIRKKSQFTRALAAASLLVFLRTIFRLAETSQGVFGYLSSHEAYFGGLECAPMLLAVLILAVWHPGRCLPEGKRSPEVTDVQDRDSEKDVMSG